MSKRHVKAILGVVAGAIVGAVITLLFHTNVIGVIVGAIFGVSLGPIAKWTDGLKYGAIIGGVIGAVIGLIGTNSGSRITYFMVSASMGAFIGAMWGGAIARVFKADQQRFPR
jgi:uncharacterized membrane protein